jgi:signal transduction histidine kinase
MRPCCSTTSTGRTSLGSFLSSAWHDLLLTGSLGHLSEKQRDILQESKRELREADSGGFDVPKLLGARKRKLVLQLRENDLRDCLEEIARRFSAAFQRKGVKPETQLDPSIPAFRFDYQKIQQATENLLHNALKHMPSGGTVTLRASPRSWERRGTEGTVPEERRRIRLRRPNSVEVSVTDSGRGIAPEQQQRIFEEFAGLDRTSPGVRLGSAITKRFIQAHAARIWVESEQSRGSRFVFLLPMDQN